MSCGTGRVRAAGSAATAPTPTRHRITVDDAAAPFVHTHQITAGVGAHIRHVPVGVAVTDNARAASVPPHQAAGKAGTSDIARGIAHVDPAAIVPAHQTACAEATHSGRCVTVADRAVVQSHQAAYPAPFQRAAHAAGYVTVGDGAEIDANQTTDKVGACRTQVVVWVVNS